MRRVYFLLQTFKAQCTSSKLILLQFSTALAFNEPFYAYHLLSFSSIKHFGDLDDYDCQHDDGVGSPWWIWAIVGVKCVLAFICLLTTLILYANSRAPSSAPPARPALKISLLQPPPRPALKTFPLQRNGATSKYPCYVLLHYSMLLSLQSSRTFSKRVKYRHLQIIFKSCSYKIDL